MSIAFDGLKEDGYQFGNCQAIPYDRTRTDLFPEGYLGKLYGLCKGSRRRSGDGILTTIFEGNPESTYDAIVSYLAPRPLVIMGTWDDGVFTEAGFAFPTIFCGMQAPEKAVFAGYGFFSHVWGKPELEVLAMLGMTYMFQEWGLKAIHGIRHTENLLTKKFTEKFGFHQVGVIPHYQLKNGKLVSGIVSSLLREDFEQYVEGWLVEQYRDEMPAVAGSVEHPAIEESQATIDAQVKRLVAGDIPVVFMPEDSTYIAALPDGIHVEIVSEGPGAGIYYFDKSKVSAAEIRQSAADGTHGKLLGHVENKMDVVKSGDGVVVQAIGPDGVVLQDSVVSRTAEAIAVQVEAFKRRFPDCECRVKRAKEVLDERVKPLTVHEAEVEPAQIQLSWR